MDESVTTTRRQGISRHGNTIAKSGTVACGLAMVIGFLVALVMHWFSDPENPTQAFGMIFAGVLVLFCVGVAAIAIGLILWTTEGRPGVEPAKLKRKPDPAGGSSPGESPVDADDEAEGEPVAEKKSWDEAYSSARRRRL